MLYLAVAILVAACSPKAEDPALTALKAKLSEALPDAKEIYVKSFEKVDSTTFGQEYQNRLDLFDVKIKVLTEQCEKYMKAGKTNNAAVKQTDLKKAAATLARVSALKESVEAIKDKVAYYDYKFSAVIKSEGGSQTVDGWYACITPENEVIGYTSKQKDLHKGVGKLIPGYKEALGGEEE